MKILLDTTYLLPTVGIAVKELPRDAINKLLSRGHEIAISQISLFELSAKGAKFIKKGLLKPEVVAKGIRALNYSDQIETIPMTHTQLLLTAFRLRNMMDDFVDCLILATAINHCDELITEDNDILNLRDNGELLKVNPAFKIKPLSEVLPRTK